MTSKITNERPKKATLPRRLNPTIVLFAFIFSVVLPFLAFLTSIPFFDLFLAFNTPTGDPFIYQMGGVVVAHQTTAGFMDSLLTTVTSTNWYWLYHVTVVFLSSFIIEHANNILYANFLWMSFAIITIYLITYRVFSNVLVSCFSSAPFFLMPWLYNSDYPPTSLDVFMFSNTITSIDTLFLYVMIISLFLLCAWATKINSLSIAILSGLSVPLALMGRGNALMPMLMVVFIPYFFILINALQMKDGASLYKYYLAHFVPLIALTTYFYYHTGSGIYDYYYFVGREFDKSLLERLLGLGWIIRNVPGFLFTGESESLMTYFFSLVFNCFVFVSVVWTAKTLYRTRCLKLEVSNEIKLTVIINTSSFALFYGSIFGTAFLLGPLYLLPGYQYSQPFVVTAVSVISIIVSTMCMVFITNREKIEKASKASWIYLSPLILAAVLGPLVYNVLFNLPKIGLHSIQSADATAKELKAQEKPSSPMVKRGGDILAFLGNEGEKVAWTTYGNYNQAIVDYYRIIGKSSRLRPYYGTIQEALASVPNPEKQFPRDLFVTHMRRLVAEAEMIIVPEYLENYESYIGLTYKVHADVVAEILGEESTPRYEIAAVLHETPNSRLFVLKRIAPWETSRLESALLFPKIFPTKRNPVNFNGKKILSDTDYSIVIPKRSSIYPGYQAVSRLVDGRKNEFWERIGSAHQVVFVAPFGKTITSYKLIPFDLMSIRRMPTSWSVENSFDGLTWSLIDSVLDLEPEAENSHKIPSLPELGPYYRFTFKLADGEGIIRIGEFLPVFEGPGADVPMIVFDCIPVAQVGETCLDAVEAL